jgi:hypothetical protein
MRETTEQHQRKRAMGMVKRSGRRQHQMRNFKKNIKNKKRESTTLASGLGVVVVKRKRKREKMNSVSLLVSRQHVRKKRKQKN